MSRTIDIHHLAQVVGGNGFTDASCKVVADKQYTNDVHRLAQPGMPGSAEQLNRAMSLAWSDSRGYLERCQTRANAALAAGVPSSALDFDKLGGQR